MATVPYLNALKAQIDALEKVNLERLARSTLGEESLATELEARLKRIDRLKKLITQYAEYVHDDIVNSITQTLLSIAQQMSQQAARNNPEFIAQRQVFLNSIDATLEAAKRWEMHFVAAGVEARGFLEDEGIRHEYQRTVTDLKKEAEATLGEVKNEAKRTIEEAKALGKGNRGTCETDCS